MQAYGGGDLDNSDISSDFGSVTTGSSSRSRSTMASSSRTSRRRRKMEKKKFSLKPGSRFEEEGLLNALHELYVAVERQLADGIEPLIAHLTLASLDTTARNLQGTARKVVDEFRTALPLLWPLSPPVEDETAALLREHPLSKMCANAETLDDVRVFIPPKINFAKFEMHLHLSSS